jgi:hypothetical protein
MLNTNSMALGFPEDETTTINTVLPIYTHVGTLSNIGRAFWLWMRLFDRGLANLASPFQFWTFWLRCNRFCFSLSLFIWIFLTKFVLLKSFCFASHDFHGFTSLEGYTLQDCFLRKGLFFPLARKKTDKSTRILEVR